VFKLNTPAAPEQIALINSETGETVAAFGIKDEPLLWV